jgi:hypothetical protein
MAAAKKTLAVELRPIQLESMDVPLVGTAPLIMHRFAEKAQRQIEEKQQKKAKQAKEARDPDAEYLAACHVMPGNSAGDPGCAYGCPAVWFKAAAVDACTWIDGMTKVGARGSFHVREIAGGLIPLEFREMSRRTDPVTISMGTRDLRYRPQFDDWRIRLTIDFNAAAISPEQIINLFNVAGFAVGVGEWRPQRDGSFGRFRVQDW